MIRPRLLAPTVAVLGAAVALGVSGLRPANGAAQAGFTMGVPTVVDPIRGVGEPDIAALGDRQANPFISGPAGSSTQTSFFWQSRDGGVSFVQRGPHNGHWVCPAVGGGDSLNVPDRVNGDIYVVDQESLAQLGLGKIDGTSGALSSQCANEPGFTADRPFFAVLHPPAGATVQAPQYVADNRKPISYLSWQCNGCQGATPTGLESGQTGGGGLAYAWTDDGVTFHPAEPNAVGSGDPITGTVQSSSVISTYRWHGPMVADPVTGDVFTALSCNGTCSTSPVSGNQFGVVVGVPQAQPSASNPGQFGSLYYQLVASKEADGSPIPNEGSLFPVVAMDGARTLYEEWIQGPGTNSSAKPTPTDWHLYYAYSTCVAADKCTHKTWSKPIQVDHGSQTAISAFGWMSAGDKGKLGFVWLGTSTYEHPSLKNPDKVWYPFTAVTTNGDTPKPTFQQTRIGLSPSHLNDICLFGTLCVVPDTNQGGALGNRNMADFISSDIGPDGALQITYANDANNIASLPTSLLPGLPVTMYAREVSGPRLIGSGEVPDSRFSAIPSVDGISDAGGDAIFPVDPVAAGTPGANVPQLDLLGVRVDWDGSNLAVHIPVTNLSTLTSPDSAQPNVWWLASWKFQNHIYFAKAEVDAGGTPQFLAGTPRSYDRVAICLCTSPTLVDYQGGTAVTGKRNGNEWVITVPASMVGNPATGAVLDSVAAYTMLDNGQPLFVGPGVTNIPAIVDATGAYNALLRLTPGLPTATPSGGTTGTLGSGTNPNTEAARATATAAGLVVVVLVAAVVIAGRRRRGA